MLPMHKWFNYLLHISKWLCVGYVLWASHFPECCVVLSVQWIMRMAQHKVTEEQIIIFHLALQVYCSPSLKQHLHNPVMTLLACKIERTVSILCANVLCVACAWCMVVCTSALVCAFMWVSAFRMVDTNLQVYVQCNSNQTNTAEHI